MSTVSAIVLTKNEEENIGECLSTLRWADEVLVLDCFSEDATCERAKVITEKVYQRRFINFPDQRNASLDLAQCEWVFFVDADERVTPELAREVRAVIEGRYHRSNLDELPVGYWVPRRNIILGKWIQHAGWYPDYQLRLFKRNRGRYDDKREVHELVVLDGLAGYLKEPYVHYNYKTLGQLFSKQDAYSSLEAKTLSGRGVRPKPHNFVLQPLREFKRRYVEWEGYKDGWHGFFLSALMAWYNFITYLKLARLKGEPEDALGKR